MQRTEEELTARLTTGQVTIEVIHAIPMTYSDYLDLRGWTRQIGEEGDVPGYLVQREVPESNLRKGERYLTWVGESDLRAEQKLYTRLHS